MVKRICLNCGTAWYSADTVTKIWDCQSCGFEIPKSEERCLDESDVEKGTPLK